MQNKTCLCCGKSVYFLNHYSGYKFRKCKFCGYFEVYPKPDDSFLKQFYNSQKGFTQSEIAVFPRRNEMIMELIKKYLKGGGRCYEIGVGNGTFFKKLKQEGFDVKGCDISSAAFKNKDVEIGKFTNFNYKRKYDLIYTSHVFEHLNNPEKTIKSIYRALKNKGYLLIAVPNEKSLTKSLGFIFTEFKDARFVNPPGHLNFFNKKSLTIFLKRNEFKIIKVANYPVISSNLFIGLISNCFNSYNRFFKIFIKKINKKKEKENITYISEQNKKIFVKFSEKISDLTMPIQEVILGKTILGDDLIILAQKY